MRFGLLGNDPDGVALACALVSSGRYQIAAATAPVSEDVIRSWNSDFRRSIDIEEVLADPAIGLVIVAGPLSTRGQQLRRAVQSERHVLCVAPADRTFETAYEAGMMQQDTGFVLMPILPRLFHPALLRLGELLREGSSPGPPALLQIEAHARSELLMGLEEGGVRPNFPGWDILRLLGGDIDEVSAFADGDELRPGSPVLLAGRFLHGGLFQLTLLPGQPDDAWRLTAFGRSGSAELYLPQGWEGPAFLNHPAENGLEREETWEANDPWPAVVAAFETAARHLPGRSAPPREQQEAMPPGSAVPAGPPPVLPTWQDAVRALELDDAARRSIEKRRPSALEYQEGGEQAGFKGMMTLVGCSLVWCVLLVLIVVAWVPQQQQAAEQSGLKRVMTLVGWIVIPLLLVFLVLQLLRYIIPERPKPEKKPSGEQTPSR
jgi:predicted dehydrogenase